MTESTEPNETETTESTPRVLLTESTLWKENVYILDHTSIWGSFYKAEDKLWGFACCQSTDKNSPCPAAAEAREEQERAKRAAKEEKVKKAENAEAEDDDKMSGEESSSTDDPSKDISAKKKQQQFLELQKWNNPPKEFLPIDSEELETPQRRIEHFIRYWLGQWQHHEQAGFVGFKAEDVVKFKEQKTNVHEAQKAVQPLIKLLEKGEKLERGERDWKTLGAKRRAIRAGCEGKYQEEKNVTVQLDDMVTNGWKKNYKAAHKVYMDMTLGHKTWNSTFVQHVAACTNKGCREYRRNRDALNTYDVDETAQRYMQFLRKLIHFKQCLDPNDDETFNFHL
eukprot:gnl/MRDRNA2_/MRDRNA2_100724_c0_seq1.p1 gnl/MRDRNA2_/MRDRNA2_100724_c0~~gnl/MRDRNA2_/MRDRNA2_100724_c0_seq1.p1  ORF type:complete len:339 (+),score=86.16 gnl/MRDRNA2_/MRDRNA2_100724_c0_seq1:104-1120(+)